MNHTKAERQTPKAEYRKVCIRSGGKWIASECIGGHCEECDDKKRDWRPLEFAHWRKHRKMGGTTNPEVHSAENLLRVCAVCHDKHDKRTQPYSEPTNNRPPMPVFGYSGLHAYPRGMQTGRKVKED